VIVVYYTSTAVDATWVPQASGVVKKVRVVGIGTAQGRCLVSAGVEPITRSGGGLTTQEIIAIGYSGAVDGTHPPTISDTECTLRVNLLTPFHLQIVGGAEFAVELHVAS